MCLRFAILSYSEKLWNVFEIVLEKIPRHTFVVYVLIYPLSKFVGNRTNFLWVLALYSVRFKWQNWFEKTALNMSIRREIFTSFQKHETAISLPILNLFQWHLFEIRDFIWSITLNENSKFEENCRSEAVYGNFKEV